MRDALTMGPRRGEDTITPHTRPPTDEDADHVLVRTVKCIEGSVEVELVCEPGFDYGRVLAEWTLTPDRHRADATGADQSMRLQTDMLLGIEADHVRARHVLGRARSCSARSPGMSRRRLPTDVEEANALLRATTAFLAPLAVAGADPRPRVPPFDPALGAGDQGLTYMPTGATVAALTTSLPETPGGERNWDYRYTWVRDSTFTLQALHYLDLDWEADEFMQFIADLERNEDGALQIMYGIDGRRDLTEKLREDLSGYDGASPVRIGNGAFDQRQNDVFGAALDSVLLHTRRSQRLPRRLWPLIQAQAECAKAVWRQPDQGIWEARGKPQHYVSSKLMCWVAMDRAAKLAEIRGENEPGRRVERGRGRDQGRHPRARGRQARRALPALRHRVAGRVDAAGGDLRLPAGDDERLRASVLAIADELTEHGFVLRYRTDETDDGLSGKEGTFVICSFWLVSALAIIGEMQRARDLMDAAGQGRVAAAAVRRGVRRRHRPAPRQLPAGVLAPRAGRGRRADHPCRATRGGRRMSDSYDVIVIGSGAGGGTLVHRLAPSGKRILLLERGGWLPREPQNWLARNVFVENRYVSPDTWYYSDGSPFHPEVHYWVGGATKRYGAALYRLRQEDFGELRHHGGISPAWPISYEEMEPHYTQAEQLYQVHGARGEDPTEPPASAPYPFPAVSHEPRIQQLSDDLAKAGLHPFHAPCGVLLDESNMPLQQVRAVR